MKNLYFYCCLSLFIFFSACKTGQKEKEKSQLGLVAERAMVVSAREEASKIGIEILKKGGNAFDAMAAVEMALAVSYPYAGNLGGGGFMVYRRADGMTGALDYREKAALAASKTMFLDENGEPVDSLSRDSALAIGVPGAVAGIFAAHEKLGSLPMDTILKPVIALAKNGFVVTKKQEDRLDGYVPAFKRINGKRILFSGPANDSTATWKAGDTIKNPKLAETLQRISDNGKGEFYGGETGKIMVDFIQARGGIITLEDLKKYEAVWRDPIEFKYKDINVISMSPPSSGGVAIAQIMGMIAPYDLTDYGHNSLKAVQVITEAERRAYADRSFYLGDPDFVDVPIKELASESYLKQRMSNFSFDRATPSSELEHGQIPGYESMETTHYSIIDQYGNAIAVTTTLNAGYGCKLFVEDLGIFLNNEMDDFSAKSGSPNMFGLLGAEANSIAPQKRMLSSMTPTLVEKNGKLWMSVGTPGGSTIITSVLQTILNVEDFGMTMQEAVDASRFHHQWMPDVITFEPNGFKQALLDSLAAKGYEIKQEYSVVLGRVDGIRVLPDGTLEGGADRRGDDKALGF